MTLLLKPSEFNKIAPHHQSLFFSSDGILINKGNNTPFITFEQGAKYFSIQSVIKDNDILVVQGTLSSVAPFQMVAPKSYLRGVASQYQPYILRAIHLVEWDKRTKYCSVCSEMLSFAKGAAEKKCSGCHKSFFPNLSPAVMVLVHNKERVLLGRSPNFAPGMYSALAGFVDMGESAEAAAIREVKEEVGLSICNLKYFGSQSWPFPSSFMIAFTAEYAEGEIFIDPNEIEDARWFSRDTLPDLPPMPTIARVLIDSYINASLG